MADDADRAYIVGLTLLSRRELAEAQLRTRLLKRKFDQDDIDAAVARLRNERALDDRRGPRRCDVAGLRRDERLPRAIETQQVRLNSDRPAWWRSPDAP